MWWFTSGASRVVIAYAIGQPLEWTTHRAARINCHFEEISGMVGRFSSQIVGIDMRRHLHHESRLRALGENRGCARDLGAPSKRLCNLSSMRQRTTCRYWAQEVYTSCDYHRFVGVFDVHAGKVRRGGACPRSLTRLFYSSNLGLSP